MAEIHKSVKNPIKRKKKPYKSPVVCWGSRWVKENEKNKTNKSSDTPPMGKETTDNTK